MHKTLVGVSLSLAAGAFLSTGGIALRLIEDADGYQILFYRALTLIVCMSVYLVMRHRARLWDVTVAIGPPGLIIAFALGMGATLYVQAILHTSVANTVVILSTSPLLTAFLSWMVLGERASRSTVAAALVALAGVGIMVVDGLDTGGLLGMGIALGAAVSFAVMLVVMQRHQNRDMLPATGLSGVVTMLVAFVASENLGISPHDLGVSIFLGSVQFGLGFALITLAARFIDGALVALLTLSEVVLAPLWVWIGVGETPSAMALTGGTIVFVAVLNQAISVRNTSRPI